MLIIYCLILDINHSSYSLVFFALPKGSTPSLFLFFFPLLIWASQVIMMIMVFIFNLSVSSYTIVNWFFLSRINLHNDGSCDRALYYSLSPVLQDHSQLGGSQVSWWWLLNFCTLHHQVHFADLRLFISVQCAKVLRTEGWGGSRLADFPALFFQLLSDKMSWVGDSTRFR